MGQEDARVAAQGEAPLMDACRYVVIALQLVASLALFANLWRK